MSAKRVLVTFDIDGTMIGFCGCSLNHPKSFITAFKELFGVDASNYREFFTEPMDGWMDERIAQWMLKKIGVESEENMRTFQNRVEELFLESTNEKIDVLPGVRRVLETLSRMDNVSIGVASGNYPKIGWRKLELAEISEFFEKRIFAFGDHFTRSEALKSAETLAEEKQGFKFDVKIHVGDTTIDVQAAKEVGFIPVFVKTGNTEAEVPKDCYVLESLEDGFDEFMRIVKET